MKKNSAKELAKGIKVTVHEEINGMILLENVSKQEIEDQVLEELKALRNPKVTAVTMVVLSADSPIKYSYSVHFMHEVEKQ